MDYFLHIQHLQVAYRIDMKNLIFTLDRVPLSRETLEWCFIVKLHIFVNFTLNHSKFLIYIRKLIDTIQEIYFFL